MFTAFGVAGYSARCRHFCQTPKGKKRKEEKHKMNRQDAVKVAIGANRLVSENSRIQAIKKIEREEIVPQVWLVWLVWFVWFVNLFLHRDSVLIYMQSYSFLFSRRVAQA